MSNKNRQNNMNAKPLIVMIVVAVVFALAAAGFGWGQNYIRNYRETALDKAQLEATDRNAKLEEQYNREMADYQQELNARAGANAAWPTPSGEGWEVVDLTNYPLENPQRREMTRQDVMYNGMLLVNEWHSRPEDFNENLLVNMYSYSKQLGNTLGVRDSDIELFPDAAQAFYTMIVDAKAQGYEHYVLQDAYRSYDRQSELFNAEMAKLQNRYSGDALVEAAKKKVNYPGTSAYNGGQTAQLILYEYKNDEVNDKVFFQSPEGLWIYENAWRYGIIFRFPLADYPVEGTTDKSYKTGVSVKLQTFSYVGKGNAAAMKVLDLCLEEYIEYLMEHPHIALFENGVLRYEINRQYVGDAEAFQVEVVGNGNVKKITTSMDNMSYLVNVFEY